MGTTNYDRYTDNEFRNDILDILIDGESVKNLDNPTISVAEIKQESSGSTWPWIPNYGNWANSTSKRFSITLSNFEETAWQAAKQYKEWSGNITLVIGDSADASVTISDDEITKNTANQLFTDFIKPEISIDSITPDDTLNTVEIELKATDKYYTPDALLDANKIMVMLNGTPAEKSDNITITYGTPQVLNGTRNGATAQYGISQTITITGLAAHLDSSIKLRIQEGAVADLSGNLNELKDISLFSFLMKAESGAAATTNFLGNTYGVTRQNIESITFLNNTTSVPASNTWDVSAGQDGSIIAYYTGSGPYQVYIASDSIMYANVDSSYLFTYIGSGSSCTATSVINGLNYLNTKFTENMSSMFERCGSAKMLSLSLGSNFNTAKVTNMNRMFYSCGYYSMTSLSLGTNFDTSNVTDMKAMFYYCGYGAMTTMNLGSKFNTSKVTTMEDMFQGCGYTGMSSLSLGNEFYTTNVENMSDMFWSCGTTAMTTLDLGPAFTKIADTSDGFINNCGKSGEVTVHTGEAIYSSANAFKLSTADGAGTIDFTRGTINPKYKPEWSKVTAVLSTDNKSLTIKLQGAVNATNYGDAIKTVENKLINGILEENSTITMSVSVDGQTANNMKRELTMVTSGPSETVTAQIILSDFEEEVLQTGKSYMEWAGNIALQIATGTLEDHYGNRNLVQVIQETETIDTNTNGKMFADFVKPIVRYEYSDTSIDQTNKKAIFSFSVLDKYYASENLSLANTEIQMDGTDLRQTPVEIAWAEEDITEASGNIIGRRYTITLTELQQNIIASGKSYLDFSGIVSIIIPSQVTDKSGNKNTAKTLTVGIDEPENPDHDGEPEGEVNHNTGTIIDFVDPMWTNVENGVTLDFTNNIATVRVKATDKYLALTEADALARCTLTSSDIEFYLDQVKTTTGVTISISNPTLTSETRTVNGVSTTVYIGAEYTITITGISLNSDQAKIVIPAGTIVDEYGNTSESNEIILYNRLMTANTEKDSTSPFLGNTNLQRQDIQRVVFVQGLAGSEESGVQTVWDVSAMQDETILAWYKETTAPYTVYIGSEGSILANRDSSYLFAHIGFGASSRATQAVENMSLLDTSSVTNMQGMFWFCGYQSMQSLDLGTSFKTSNVTNMKEMFTGCGYTAMTTLNLGSNFNTSAVTNMSYMFANCGYTAMTTLNLGSNFNTSAVTDMSYMFADTGYTKMTTLTLGNNFNTANVLTMNSMFKHTGHEAMTSLNLGSSFNTAKVTDMGSMFEECGYKAMTTLNLGTNFNTTLVTNMNKMFYGCGATAMTSLTLGDNFNTTAVTDMNSMFMKCGQTSMTSLSLGGEFYTTNVTDMTNMFNGCGQNSMTSLDLGPAFTKIAATNEGFATDCGKNENITIHVGESIYSNEHAFKLNSDSTTEIAFTRGTINPKYRPKWTKLSTSIDTTNKTLTVIVEGDVDETDYAGYLQTVTRNVSSTSGVTVSIDGESSADTNITKTVSAVEGQDKQCQIVLSNFGPYDQTNGKTFDEWSGNIAVILAKGTLTDAYGNKNLGLEDENVQDETKTNKNENGKMFTDFIKPEIRYEYSETQIDIDTNIVTVYFSVTDKYFKGLTSTIANAQALADAITVKVDNVVPSSIQKTIKEEDVTDVEYVIDSMNTVVGKKYKLVIEKLDTGDGINFSGPMTITFPVNLAEDHSGNTSDSKSITIGIDDPTNPDHDHNTGVIVDVVDPIWKIENQTATSVDLVATDKYFKQVLYTTEQLKSMIQVKVGETIITEGITLTGPTTVTNGVKYTLTIPDFSGDAELEAYEDFLAERELYETTNGAQGRLYREQFAGDIIVTIPADTIEDQSGNKNKAKEFNMGQTLDTLSPETVFVSSQKDTTNKTETIVFDITDKYFSYIGIRDANGVETNAFDEDEIFVSIDNVLATSVNKEITNVETLSAVIDGIPQTIGKRYTVVLSDFATPGLEGSYDFKGLSGTVSIEIAEGMATDQSGNISGGRKADGTNTSEGQPMVGDLVDFIKPSIIYRSSETIKNTNEVQIIFDVTDKYYSTGTLTINDLTVKIQDGTVDTNYINVKDIAGVGLSLSSAPKYETETFNKTVAGQIVTLDGTDATLEAQRIIGTRYTLTISNLEQAGVAGGRNYLDYSGNVTIAVDGEKVEDTSGNKNEDKTITMGIEEPDGTGVKEELDIVRPSWELLSQSVDIDNQISTIRLKVTDKYFSNSSLDEDVIELYITENGISTKAASNGVTITNTEVITESWTINGVASNVVIGAIYDIKVEGFATDKEQAKIKIPEGVIVDKSGNESKEFTFIIYSCLMSTQTESTASSIFLNNPNPHSIQRQNVENVTFVSGLSGANSTKWDVSAAKDQSIMAWYETTANGKYKVYIGSDGAIFANPNSSYLFAYIGHLAGANPIVGLNLLNTDRVTNMNYMFFHTGKAAMTTLDLGHGTASTEDDFNTSNVTTMEYMFRGCGNDAMTTFNLGGNFDTTKVTDMDYMFYGCGQNSMTSLSLGEKFDTSEVTSMYGMFWQCGKSAMTSLELGDKFNTQKVTTMKNMFRECGTTAMTSLDLGDQFYTTLVTDMTNMFNGCGTNAMTSLDLGPAFAKIASTCDGFVTNCGKAGENVIKAGQAIYGDINTFKEGNAGSVTVDYANGTIDPIYRPEWSKVTTQVVGNTLEITVQGIVDTTIYESGVTGELNYGDDITVYVNGNKVDDSDDEDDDINVSVIKQVTEIDADEAKYKITLSNFEESLRRSGKNFKEWSGNISLQFGGGTLIDDYGHQNLSQINIDTAGTWEQIILMMIRLIILLRVCFLVIK